MSAGTIRLTNGSTAVVGTGTTFTSELKSGDVVTATVGGIFYTLFVDAVTSNTALTLTDSFTGPTTSGLAWVAVPQLTLNRITASLAAQTAESVRRVLQENANWQAFYSGTGDITVTLPDGSPAGRPLAGPSWSKMSALTTSAQQWRGQLPTDANINTYGPTADKIGKWGKYASVNATIAFGFPEDAAVGDLEVIPYNQFGGAQKYVVRGGKMYLRNLTAAWNGVDGPWSTWYEVGGLSSYKVLPAATSLTDSATFSQHKTYVLTGTRTDLPAGVTSDSIVMSTYRSGGILNQMLFDRTGTYERHGKPDAATNWTTVNWYAGGDANGWRLIGADAMAAIGLGLSSQVAATFDWQQFDLASGQSVLVNVSAWTNAPAGLPFVSGDVVVIECVVARNNANRYVLRITSQATGAGNRKDCRVVVYNAKGSRSFGVDQNFTSDSVVPVANGGTGGNTQAAGRTGLGLGSAATRNTGITSGTVPLVSSMFNMGLKGGHVEFANTDAWYSMMKQYGLMSFRPSTAISAPYNFISASPTLWCNTGETYFLMNVPHTGNGPIHIMAGYAETGFGVDRLLWDNVNTTVDASGYIKKASPVIKLFNDGSAEVNAEAEGCVVTRTGLGEYLIEGCMGLHSDAAWGGTDGGFDIPVDINKQPKIWLDYQVNADGSIVVKTYHREHASAPKFARNIIEGVADGDPIDIPADQFVSVRVEMPIDSIWNKKQEEARVESEALAAQYRADEEARLKAEQEAREVEEKAAVDADFESLPPETPEEGSDVQQ